MAIRIRVYPQPGSVGAKRNKALKLQQQQQQRQQRIIRQQQLQLQQQQMMMFQQGTGSSGWGAPINSGYGAQHLGQRFPTTAPLNAGFASQYGNASPFAGSYGLTPASYAPVQSAWSGAYGVSPIAQQNYASYAPAAFDNSSYGWRGSFGSW